MLVVLRPALATSGHETVIPWRGREFVTCLGARFHPRFMKKRVMSLLKVKKHCTSATGIAQCSSRLRSVYLWPWAPKLLNTFQNYFGSMTHSSSDLNSLSTAQREEIFPSIDLKFICNLLQWSILIFSSPWENRGKKKKKKEMAAPFLFMFSVIINICIQSPSYKQNNPTLQSLMPAPLLHSL